MTAIRQFEKAYEEYKKEYRDIRDMQKRNQIFNPNELKGLVKKHKLSELKENALIEKRKGSNPNKKEYFTRNM